MTPSQGTHVATLCLRKSAISGEKQVRALKRLRMDQASYYPLGSTNWEALPSLGSFKLPEASGMGASRSPSSILRNALEAE